MNKIYIIGVGPGNADYLLPIAKKKIIKADCLIGAKRHLSLFKGLNKEKIYLKGDFEKTIQYIKKNKSKKKIAVLVSGDVGLYSLLGRIQKVFKKEEYEVIPGISSMQLAFARIGEQWNDVQIVSVHGRKLSDLAKTIKNSKKVFLFTDKDNSPDKIAKYLVAKSEGQRAKSNMGNRRAIVFENLSYYNERIIDTDLKNLSKMRKFGLCVMIIIAKNKE
jgi:cobalt-precorrin-7 (C5)-methyltransferase